MKVRFISLFCGIGNADAGMYAAAADLGIEVECVGAYDSWDKAVDIYNRNMPHPVAVVADVKRMTHADLPPHDLVIGGPPCQAHSLAGLRKCKCHLGGHVDPSCCLADFLRLAGDTPYLMENVVSRLINAPFSVKLNAFHFSDVTTRKRWFYSNYLLHVLETPGPLRFGDIRDHEADRIAIAKRKNGLTEMDIAVERKKAIECVRQGQNYTFPPRGDADALGSLGSTSSHRLQSGSTLVEIIPEDGACGSLTQSSFHGHKNNGSGNPTERMRSVGQSKPTQDDDALGSLTSGKGGSTGFLKVGLCGHSASASAFDDDEPIGSLIANSWHGNEISKLGPSVRCPSLLEMARAHSIPDTFDWGRMTKTDRGKAIANSWPRGMAAAVCRAMLVAIGAIG